MSNYNPYETSYSTNDPSASSADAAARSMPERDVKKAEAIIKDANQFWLAILASFFCSLFGAVLIVPWYSIRFVQHRNLSIKYPILLTYNAPSNSLANRFQRSNWKLVTAVIFGCFIFMFYVVMLLILVALSPAELAR